MTRQTNQGFTLVELSIVIIIIGFLIAGVSAGIGLIKQAALNSVISDFQYYKTAYDSFVGRYNEIPGDMINAESYWPTCTTVPGTCNGNGNGEVGDQSNELLSAWKDLAFAEMISTVPAGPITQSSIGNNPIIGVDIPGSKISSTAGYSMGWGNNNGPWGENTDTFWDDSYTNAVFIGSSETTPGGYQVLDNGILISIDAFNIDQKIDDGNIDSSGNLTGAASGKVRTFEGYDEAQYSCLLSNNYAAPFYYNPNGTGTACAIGIALNAR